MNAIIRNIPNTITCLNLLAGCMAIVAASMATDTLWGLPAYQWAFIFIGIGAAADFLDGFAARSLHAYSSLGKELDSLCDLVTFGVAPAMIVLHLFLGLGAQPWVAWTALLIPVAGALRLARFNIDTRQATTFIGLPIPANAIFWIGYASLFAQDGVSFLSEWYWFIPVLAVECWLMNSPLRIFSLKFKNLHLKENMPRFLLIAATLICCVTLGAGGLLWLIVFYVLLSVALKE
ncbi:MAG: CDP-diacylglycerol--serine O-phosphatidyltransferase [Muribaculaceae bacterium]|nr:CDP-diacylglycerol--serine O-phosphatidyltransferase [Muribaculaceae bacterium]